LRNSRLGVAVPVALAKTGTGISSSRYRLVMLCTVVLDAYEMGEREDVREALQVLTGPGQPDWSPMGCYCYWDRDTQDPLSGAH
jgi:hypothetical protein